MPTSLNYGITSKAMTLIELRNYIEGNDIDNYLEGKSETSMYCDQITHKAIADLFAVNICVLTPGKYPNCIVFIGRTY